MNPTNQADRKRVNALIDWANKQFSSVKDERGSFERQWHLNYSFYKGKQNVVFRNAESRYNQQFQLWTPPAPYYKARPIINKVRPIARREMAKLTAQKPSVSVVPQSSDDQDLFAAQASEQIWEYAYDTYRIAKVIREAVFWSVIAGTGFIKCWWDADAFDYSTGGQGKICYERVTPFHLFAPDLKCEELEYQPFLLHAQLMSADALKTKFQRPIEYSSNLKGVDDNYATMLGVQQWAKDRSCLVMEFWVKPGNFPLLPEGGMFTIAGNQLLNIMEGQPYKHGRYPFAQINDVHTGQFYADSVIVDLIPLQREYNRTRGQIIESKNRMGKPQMMVEEGSTNIDKITSEPGLIIPVAAGFRYPELLQPPNLPAYVENELLRIEANMDDISGQHDVSRGTAPTGVTAATAISYLQEADDTMLSYTFDSVEECVEKVAFLTLNYVHDYWDDGRLIKVSGIDESFDDFEFKSSNIASNADIRVEGGSALPTSKAAKQALITDWMEKGFITSDIGLKVLEFGGMRQIYEQLKVDDRQARRENLKMRNLTTDAIQAFIQSANQKVLAESSDNPYIQQDETGQIWDYTVQAQMAEQQGLPQGQPLQEDPNNPLPSPEPVNPPLIVPVNTWDNHAIHIQVHNDYRKSQSFEALPDELKTIFEQHVQGHIDALQSMYQANLDGALAPPVADTEGGAPNPSGSNQFSGIEQNSPSDFGGLSNGAA